MELDILTSTSIKAKKPRSSYWWLAEVNCFTYTATNSTPEMKNVYAYIFTLAQNTCAQSVYLLEGTRIETLNLKNGKVRRVSPQIKERSSLMTFGTSSNGRRQFVLWLCFHDWPRDIADELDHLINLRFCMCSMVICFPIRIYNSASNYMFVYVQSPM